MINDIISFSESKMKKCIEQFNNQIKYLYIGRISENLLDKIKIKYKNSLFKIKQLGQISIENYRMLSISVFDKKLIFLIEKSISDSGLNVSISHKEKKIFVTIPEFTEEQRKNKVKLLYLEIEKSKVAIRNIRRNSNEKIKQLLKNKHLNKEQDRILKKNIQKLTDDYIKKIESISLEKECELMKF